mgnify:CR=1 FL=1
MKENIVLIGMPGAGKSTVGVVLAKRLGLSFLDSDLVIQEREGCILHEIIEKEGLDGFNEIENQVNASIDVKRTIIATGGSAVYGKEAMQHLHEIGAVFYLKLSYEELKNRKAPETDGQVELGSISTRLGRTTLEARHVEKGYGDRILIHDFSYIFLKNDRVGIIGPNGSGKSTLMKMIAGWVQPDVERRR